MVEEQSEKTSRENSDMLTVATLAMLALAASRSLADYMRVDSKKGSPCLLLQVFPQAIMAEVREKSASAPARAVVFVYVPSAHAVRALPAKGLDAALLPGLVENDSSSSGAYR